LPYLSGTWEAVWYAEAATGLPLPVRALLFLLFVHFALSVIALPLGYYSGYVVAHAFGLSRQTRRAWAVDWLKGMVLGALLGTIFGGAFLWTVVATGEHWWWVFAVETSVAGLALVFVMPYVLVPLFFKMRPLEDADTVARIHALVNRAGTPVRAVCTLDFSRRTAEANAAVIGLGRSRRVVLADTLLAEFSPTEVDAVVAHELGHHVHHDVQRLLLGNAVLMWLGLAAAAWARPAALPLLSLPSLAYVPGYPVLLCVVEVFFLVLAPVLNWWSRSLEARADGFALELTRDPAAFVGAMQRIARQNLAELRPPRWAELLLGTHPPLYRRIEMARNWKLA
jgi:STE24 endopeptidase